MHAPSVPADIYVGPLQAVQPTALKYMGSPNPPHKHASQQPLNIMCYMHAGRHICAPTASVPADQWVIYVCYTHATIRTDMAWDTSDICLLQACHPAISPSPIGLVSNFVIIPGSFCPTHTSHSVIPITTSLPPLCLGSVSILIPFDCA